jgi:enterochelin esterase-like enzyme
MNIYLLPGYSKGREYPIIYAPDGSKINMKKLQFSPKTQFDYLIENKIIRPTIIIEEHCNTKKTNSSMTFGNGDTSYTTFRTFEYVENWGQPTTDTLLKSRFRNHMNFFIFEMIPYIESKFCDTVKSTNRYF